MLHMGIVFQAWESGEAASGHFVAKIRWFKRKGAAMPLKVKGWLNFLSVSIACRTGGTHGGNRSALANMMLQRVAADS